MLIPCPCNNSSNPALSSEFRPPFQKGRDTTTATGSITTPVDTPQYDLVVIGSGFAESMTALIFLEQTKKDGKPGRIVIIEAGKNGERCGTSRWLMAYLGLDKNNNFDLDWIKEMRQVSKGLADEDYCEELEELVTGLAWCLLDHGFQLNHHDEKNVLLEFKTDQHFVFREGGGNAIIRNLFQHISKFGNLNVLWETAAMKLLTLD